MPDNEVIITIRAEDSASDVLARVGHALGDVEGGAAGLGNSVPCHNINIINNIRLHGVGAGA